MRSIQKTLKIHNTYNCKIYNCLNSKAQEKNQEKERERESERMKRMENERKKFKLTANFSNDKHSTTKKILSEDELIMRDYDVEFYMSKGLILQIF